MESMEQVCDAYALGEMNLETCISELSLFGYSEQDAYWILCAAQEEHEENNGRFGVGA